MRQKSILVFLFILLFCLLLPQAHAQNPKLSVEVKQRVEQGERFRLSFIFNQRGSGFRGPDLKNFQIISGPSTSTSSSVQIINGQMTQSITETYSYIIEAAATGEFEIGAATITYQNKTYSSPPTRIQVVPATAKQNSSSGQSGASAQTATLSKDDLYIRASLDKQSVFQGEQVIVTYRIYTKVPVSQLNITKLSSFPGFWTKNLQEDQSQLQQSTQIINGEEYIVAELRQLALFPQKTGELNIEPMELECLAQVRMQTNNRRSRDPFENFFNDPFFNRNVKNIQTTLQSNGLNLEVKPLPQKGKPQSFTGAVGQFNLKSSIDKTEVKTNEAINLKYTLSGNGNIDLLNIPAPQIPPDFDAFDPKSSDRIRTSSSGVQGSVSKEFLMIPRASGSFVIPSIDFSYFDPAQQRYITLSSEFYELNVSKGEEGGNAITYSGDSRKELKVLGSDIRYIKANASGLRKKDQFFFGSTGYISILTLSSLCTFLLIILINYQRKKKGNQAQVKNRKAKRLAVKRLSLAQKRMKNAEEGAFYNDLSAAIWGYLSDKLNIPTSELNLQNVEHKLNQREVDESLTRRFLDLLNNCEFARFAPGKPAEKMPELYNEALQLITSSEKSIKK